MFPYHLLCIAFKQKKQNLLMPVIHCVCFLLFGLGIHAKAMQKIITPHFNIGFYKSATSSAERIANTLETIYKPVCKTLGVYPNPIRLLINNQSTEVNGFFTNMPRYIRFYTLYSPDPNFIGNTDWLSMLCIHEFRHAVQHSIEYHSTPFWLKPLYFGGNLVTTCSVSHFFKEGDAVGIETALTKSGRGRLPGWEKLYKVNLLERGAASFSRQVFGSLKHEIPSEYHIGYYFTTHIRRNYGIAAIKSIFEKSIRGIPFFGFYNAVKKVTKKSILKVYKDMNQELLLNWQKQLEGLKITPATQLTIKKAEDNFDYTHPFMDASGNLMACKAGIGLRDQLVQVGMAPSEPTTPKKTFSSFRKDKTIFYFIQNPFLAPAAFAIGEGCVAWLEECKHHWKKNKETIRLQYYDFKQRSRRTLVSNSRYSALAMRPDTRQLVAVTSDEAGNHFLVVLETKSGKIVKKIDNPDNGYYLTPSWSDEDHVIVVKTKDQQNSIVRINVDTSKTEILLPYTYEHRSCPKLYKDYLLYNSSYNGIDNIYAMHLPTKACFQVTSRKYGAYLGMVNPTTNQLIFSDYTKNGMEIVAMPFDPLLWTPLEAVADRSVRYYEPLVVQEQNGDILAKVPNHLYPVTKHRFARDMLAFIGTQIVPHWYDKSLQIEPFTLVSLQDNLKATPYMCQHINIFNKFRGLQYPTTKVGLKVKYRTFYPILKVDILGTRYKKCNGIYLLHHIDKISWIPALDVGIKFPYYFTLGSSSGKASLEAKVNLNQYNKNRYYFTTFFFKIRNCSTKSKRDICAPWSQSLDIRLNKANKITHLLLEHENTNYFDAKLYFPGINHHHYFGLNPITKWFKTQKNELRLTQIVRLTYGFPLAYPECGIPLIWFLKKIWIEGYYHITYTTLRTNPDLMPNTMGVVLCFSNRLLSNENIPYVKFSIDLGFLKKPNNKWAFQAVRPKLGLTPSSKEY